MKRVLVYGNRKSGPPAHYDVSTPELEAGAFLALFKILDRDWQVYAGLKEREEPPKFEEGHPDGCKCERCDYTRKALTAWPKAKAQQQAERELYEKAKKGDALAAKRLMSARKSYEYEEWEISTVESHKAKPPKRVWGVKKPCLQAFICSSGLVRYERHGMVSYRLYPDGKAAAKDLEKRGYEAWKAGPKAAEKWMMPNDPKEIIHEPEQEDHARALARTVIKHGETKPMKRTVCPGCQREFVDPFKDE